MTDRLYKLLLTLALLILVFAFVSVGGCTMIWTDDAFIVDAGKNRDIDKFYFHRDPNGFMMRGNKYKSDPDDVEVWTPWGAGGTKGE